MTDDDVLLLDGVDDLDDVDDDPTRMERLYAREDGDSRSFNSFGAVRCPTCGRVKEWRNRRQRPFCKHDAEQTRFKRYLRTGW